MKWPRRAAAFYAAALRLSSESYYPLAATLTGHIDPKLLYAWQKAAQ